MSEENRKIMDSTGNPAPLGLAAFGMTTILLNLHNAGLFALGSMILAMGIFYGGIAQIIVGIMEWKKGSTFGTIAFLSYGLFWLSHMPSFLARQRRHVLPYAGDVRPLQCTRKPGV